MSATGDMALIYASQEWPVLQLNGKRPITDHAVKDATTDAKVIQGWWAERPNANVGIACGLGLMVLDIDGPEGQQTIDGLINEHGALPETRWVRTGRPGGMHIYFSGQGRGHRLGPGLDLRGEGSYVVAPPSLHPSGRRYKTVDDRDPAPLPEWLHKPKPPPKPKPEPVRDDRSWRRLRTAAEAAVEGELAKLDAHSTEPETERGTALFAAACALGRHVTAGGLGYAHAEAVLRSAGERLRLDEAELTRSVEHGLEEGASEAYQLTERDSNPAKSGEKGGATLKPLFATGTRPKPTPLCDVAFSGLAGRIVKLIEPQSEASAEALLVQLLTAFGNAVGRKAPAYQVEADLHPARLNIVIVGPTSRARKGTSWGRVKQVMRSADPEWVDDHVRFGGLSTGEGLIQALYDAGRTNPIEALLEAMLGGETLADLRDRQNADALDSLFEAVDNWNPEDGVDGLFEAIAEATPDEETLPEQDKRLLVHEPEFARVLRVAKREGSTVSAVLRSLWDSDEANVLTRAKPLVVREAYLSIIAHITAAELRRELSEVDVFDGFANRFLFVWSERSKCLPYGGQVPQQALDPLIDQLAQAITDAGGLETTTFGGKAKELWAERYPDLTADRPGLYGAATARAEAQVVRLALIYALLDRSRLIRVEHLRAALEIWRYCDDSARYVFGGRLGDRVAEYVMGELRQSRGHLDRNEIRQALGHRTTAAEIDVALDYLEELGLIWRESVRTKGRPIERIHLARKGAA
jgi:hypothetical protein